MIGRITGRLLEKHPPLVLLDVGGVGYEIDVPMSTFYNLPNTGETVSLHTHLIVREDAHLLYGFGTDDERQVFRTLIRVSGVGPRLALAVLSGLSVTDLALAVSRQETGRLTKIPGIGKKTAERLLLELKGKLSEVTLGAGAQEAGAVNDDVLNALVALGYNEREAAQAIRQLPDGLGVSDSIRQSLKLLSKA
jgi:holliday junction DNA helicase RuvA